MSLLSMTTFSYLAHKLTVGAASSELNETDEPELVFLSIGVENYLMQHMFEPSVDIKFFSHGFYLYRF